MAWTILYYETPSGRTVIKDFIVSLPVETQAKLARQLDLLEEYGNGLGMPHAKSMGGGLIELRVRGKQEVRVFYALEFEDKIYLLHGYVKKTQTTPNRELDTARNRQAEIENRNK